MSVPVLPDLDRGYPSASTTTITARRAAAAAVTAGASRLEKVVDLNAIRHNVRVLKEAAGGRKVMAVLTADGYGLGAVPVARVLSPMVDALAVGTVAEGLALRAAGIDTPTLVTDVDVATNAAICVDAGLTATVARTDQAERYAALGRRRGRRINVWLRTNVGHDGFGPRDDAGFRDLLGVVHRHRRYLRVVGVFAHLPDAAWEESETAAQAETFAHRLAAARARLGPGIDGSLAATYGLLHPAALRHSAWVRPGLGLYGVLAPTCRQLGGWSTSPLSRLRPAWEVRAKVLDVVTVPREKSEPCRTAAVTAVRRVASVSIGFAHGLTSAATGLTGLLHGSPCRQVGAPGMDTTQFDVTAVPQVRAGDWMTLVGRSGAVTRSAVDLSAELGCDLRELMASLRMPVRYIDA